VIANLWQEAARDLGITVITPYVIPGRSEEYIALVKDFGGPKGCLLLSVEAGKELTDLARREGYYWTQLGHSYSKYDRQSYIDALDDMGWYGDPVKVPTWYSGKPWS